VIGRFQETLAGRAAERWVETLFTPATLFWAGGMVAYAGRVGWKAIQDWFLGQPVPLQVALLLAVPLLIGASEAVMRRLQLELLRWLEGYWPGAHLPFLPTAWLYRLGRRWQRWRFDRAERKWQQLQGLLEKGSLSPDQRGRLAALERFLRRFPNDPGDIMPTALGNLLRAAETRPWHKYGLDAVALWPVFWLVLPKEAREDIATARAELDGGVRFLAWSLLFAVWGIWAWWAPLVALGMAWLACNALRGAAETYGALVEAAFDVHRTALYRALRWPLPPNPAQERALGEKLSAYLRSGSHASWPPFADAD